MGSGTAWPVPEQLPGGGELGADTEQLHRRLQLFHRGESGRDADIGILRVPPIRIGSPGAGHDHSRLGEEADGFLSAAGQ